MVGTMGFAAFTLGSLMSIAGLVLIALGYASRPWAGGIVALLAAGEVLVLGSVSFLRGRAPASAASERAVSPLRSQLGLSLLWVHLAVYFVVWCAAVLSYTRATEATPLPSILGLSFEQQGPAFVWGVALAELLFVLAAYVLGPSWRRRFAGLFRYAGPDIRMSAEAQKAPPTLRMRLGLGVFVVGNALAVAGLLLPALGFAKGSMVGVIAIMLGAGEVLSLSSIFFLGKEGFKELKSKLFRALKRVPSNEPVSRTRHRVGCTLLAMHVVLQFGALIFPIASHYGVATVGAFPDVFGLGRDEQLKWFVGLLAAGEVLFFAGVYALGEDWWARFRDLFRTEPSRRN
jgi:hypothetical protein